MCAKSKQWWNTDIKKRLLVIGGGKEKKMECEGGCMSDGRDPEVNLVVQEPNVE
jgi:hypothetical protein